MLIGQFLRRNAIALGAMAVACPVIAVGLVTLLTYANTPGPAGFSPAAWPVAASLAPRAGRSTLLLFAHPGCPCTTASIAELSRIMAVAHTKMDAVVYFVLPAGAPGDWRENSLWDAAALIPGVRAAADPEGAEARRFGARTSGQSLVYDASGQLVFSGGITAARGHEGDSDGRAAILKLASGEAPARTFVTPVFGCILVGDR